MVLKIGINARSLSVFEMRGFPRYVSELVFNMLKSAHRLDIYLFCNGPIDYRYKEEFNSACAQNNNRVFYLERKIRPKLLWQSIYLYYISKKIPLDIFHSPINVGAPLAFCFPILRVLSLHDTITDFDYSFDKFRWNRIWDYLNYYLERYFSLKCDRFITVSYSSKKDIEDKFGILPTSIDVIYNGNSFLKKYPMSKPKKERKNIFLYLGGMEDRKNILFLLSEFEQFRKNHPYDLVLAGNLKYQVSFDISLWQEKKWVTFIDSPLDSQVAILYQEATAVILPSLREGFGLQIAEAFSYGTPVLHSAIAAYQEVAGSLGIEFNQLERGALTQALEKFCQNKKDESENERMKYAEKFNWEKSAEQLIQIYNSLVKNNE